LQKQKKKNKRNRNKVSPFFFFNLIIVEKHRIVAHFQFELDADLNGNPAIEKDYIKIENKRRGE